MGVEMMLRWILPGIQCATKPPHALGYLSILSAQNFMHSLPPQTPYEHVQMVFSKVGYYRTQGCQKE